MTYRQKTNLLEMICHQCQTNYNYPKNCPKCHSDLIVSRIGGLEELIEELQKEFAQPVYRFDTPDGLLIANQKLQNPASQVNLFVSTRIYDPAIPYHNFEKIVFVQAENLLISPDYLVQEDVFKQIAEIYLQINQNTTVIFDTNSPDLNIFQKLARLHPHHQQHQTLAEFYTDFLSQEQNQRQQFAFPPFQNLVLFTSQAKTNQKALEIAKITYNRLQKDIKDLPDLSLSSPYPARFLKRKDMYSYHVLLKYPKQYPQFAMLRKMVLEQAEMSKMQIRLNPRHLF